MRRFRPTSPPAAAGSSRPRVVPRLLPVALLGGALAVIACNDDVPACFRDDCREGCLAEGYAGGVCSGTACRCLAGGDADVEADVDAGTDVDAGLDAGADAGDGTGADALLEEDGAAGDGPADETPACPTWSDVESIFRYNCGRCHPNYRTYDDVRSNLSLVRAYVAMGHYLYGSQRELVLQWIDCGGLP